MKNDFTIHTIFPNYYDETKVAYTVKSLLEVMNSPEVNHKLYVLSKKKNINSNNIKSLLPNFLLTYTSKILETKNQIRATKCILNFNISKIKSGDVAYFWINNPVTQTLKLKEKGVIVAREMINCTLAKRRQELTRAYRHFGENNQVKITDDEIKEERQQLLSADIIFCPNPLVYESVLEYGVPASKCIKTSYGWDPQRFNALPSKTESADGFNVLFVGTIDVRKGIPVLFDAWEQAKVNGKLVLAGNIDSEILTKYKNFISRPDVQHLGHVNDLEKVYKSADVFCFLSWEEGGPMVTLEAIGCGLPCIVTPMGSAGAVSNLKGGLIVSPGDINGTVGALKTLASNKELLKKLGQEAQAISAQFTWKNAGTSRIDAIKSMRPGR
jgi:glycosyltransferase involved in cell wall biosynthesis